MSVVSVLELSTGPEARPRLLTLGGRPLGGGGAGEGVAMAPCSDMVVIIVQVGVKLGEERGQRATLT